MMTGRIAHIDVGEVNGHVFLNNSSIGIYPWIVRERETEQRKGYRKWVAFARSFLSVLKRYALLHVRLRMEGYDEAEVKRRSFLSGTTGTSRKALILVSAAL